MTISADLVYVKLTIVLVHSNKITMKFVSAVLECYSKNSKGSIQCIHLQEW